MTIITFIIILAALVFVHELGHFLAAKLSGIRVDEFGLGFPPKVVSFKKGETVYSVNALPFGGFVKIFGEDGNQEQEGVEEKIKEEDKARSFFYKPKSIQAFVLVAGVLCNVLFAWLLISLGFMIGMPVPTDYITSAPITNPQVTITQVEPNSPAAQSQLKEGDVITDLKSGNDKIQVQKIDDVQNFVAAHPNQNVTVDYTRGKTQSSVNIVPKIGLVPDRAVIGVELDTLGILKLNFFKALWEGAKLTVFLVKVTAIGLFEFVKQIFIGKADLSTVSGPVGIAGLVGDARQLGFVYLLTFTSLISINLAIINLIPFPALDGGRLLIVIIEKIRGKTVNQKITATANIIGFVILIGLMLVITGHDIFKLFH